MSTALFLPHVAKEQAKLLSANNISAHSAPKTRNRTFSERELGYKTLRTAALLSAVNVKFDTGLQIK